MAETAAKKSLKERAVRELERYAIITVYLWLLFALFSLHKQLVQGHGISFWLQGFAFVNALIFGKVMFDRPGARGLFSERAWSGARWLGSCSPSR